MAKLYFCEPLGLRTSLRFHDGFQCASQISRLLLPYLNGLCELVCQQVSFSSFVNTAKPQTFSRYCTLSGSHPLGIVLFVALVFVSIGKIISNKEKIEKTQCQTLLMWFLKALCIRFWLVLCRCSSWVIPSRNNALFVWQEMDRPQPWLCHTLRSVLSYLAPIICSLFTHTFMLNLIILYAVSSQQ